MMRDAARSTHQTQDSDRATVLLMGWYKVEWDAGLGRWVYRNYGRHFVMLQGYKGVVEDALIILPE